MGERGQTWLIPSSMRESVPSAISPFVVDRASMFIEQGGEGKDFKEGYGDHVEGMVQAWVAQNLVNVSFYEFLGCPI